MVETLINNAGFGSMGELPSLDLERELEMIDFNVKALSGLDIPVHQADA